LPFSALFGLAEQGSCSSASYDAGGGAAAALVVFPLVTPPEAAQLPLFSFALFGFAEQGSALTKAGTVSRCRKLVHVRGFDVDAVNRSGIIRQAGLAGAAGCRGRTI